MCPSKTIVAKNTEAAMNAYLTHTWRQNTSAPRNGMPVCAEKNWSAPKNDLVMVTQKSLVNLTSGGPKGVSTVNPERMRMKIVRAWGAIGILLGWASTKT